MPARSLLVVVGIPFIDQHSCKAAGMAFYLREQVGMSPGQQVRPPTTHVPRSRHSADPPLLDYISTRRPYLVYLLPEELTNDKFYALFPFMLSNKGSPASCVNRIRCLQRSTCHSASGEHSQPRKVALCLSNHASCGRTKQAVNLEEEIHSMRDQSRFEAHRVDALHLQVRERSIWRT